MEPLRPKKIKCERCGVAVAVASVGRVPKYCAKHRRAGGGACLDVSAARDRCNQRRSAKKAAKKIAPIKVDLDEARALAVGMLEHPTNLHHAARSAGLVYTRDKLDAVAELARAEFAGIIDGDLSAFARQCQAALFGAVSKIRRAIEAEEIAPRDLPHAGRALAQMSSIITGDDQTPRYSAIELYVTGSDGKPIKLGNDEKNTGKPSK